MQNPEVDDKQLSGVLWHIANEMRGEANLGCGGVMTPLTAYVAMLMQDEDEGVALRNVLERAGVSPSVKDFLLSSFDESG